MEGHSNSFHRTVDRSIRFRLGWNDAKVVLDVIAALSSHESAIKVRQASPKRGFLGFLKAEWSFLFTIYDYGCFRPLERRMKIDNIMSHPAFYTLRVANYVCFKVASVRPNHNASATKRTL